jgi:hypothetical protein
MAVSVVLDKALGSGEGREGVRGTGDRAFQRKVHTMT